MTLALKVLLCSALLVAFIGVGATTVSQRRKRLAMIGALASLALTVVVGTSHGSGDWPNLRERIDSMLPSE